VCVASTEWALADTLGRAFYDRIAPQDGFALASEILGRDETAFTDGLAEAAWLDPETRARAIEKIDAVANKVGSPMPWPEIIDAQPGPDYLDNVLRFARAQGTRHFQKLEAPVDRSEWLISVPYVNAYYHAKLNEVVFPAGILQLPFYTSESLPLSFGAIGSVMGHELTHALDDEGRKFTADGRLEEWWTQTSIEEFDRRAECVVEEFGRHQIQPGLYVDGRLTLGENIADLGGIDLAHRAYLQWEVENGEPERLDGIDELDSVQLLFVAFAQTWCTLVTPESERVLAVTDVHSPPKLRVNGPLRNLPAFHEAFDCEVGSGMHPETTCEVW
jgi:endothelin-converting enzyme/putative endopeptidase